MEGLDLPMLEVESTLPTSNATFDEQAGSRETIWNTTDRSLHLRYCVGLLLAARVEGGATDG